MFWNHSKDKREERVELNKTTVEWQETLEGKFFESDDRAKEMNKNYKAHIGQTARQIANSRNGDTDDLRSSFTEDELSRENRLEGKQIESVKESSDFQETKKTLDKVRKNKTSWW